MVIVAGNIVYALIRMGRPGRCAQKAAFQQILGAVGTGDEAGCRAVEGAAPQQIPDAVIKEGKTGKFRCIALGSKRIRK